MIFSFANGISIHYERPIDHIDRVLACEAFQPCLFDQYDASDIVLTSPLQKYPLPIAMVGLRQQGEPASRTLYNGAPL